MAAEPERPHELARKEVDLFLDGRSGPRITKGTQFRELTVELVEARLVRGAGAGVGRASDVATPPEALTRLPLGAGRPRARESVGVRPIGENHQLCGMELAPRITQQASQIGKAADILEPQDRAGKGYRPVLALPAEDALAGLRDGSRCRVFRHRCGATGCGRRERLDLRREAREAERGRRFPRRREERAGPLS